MSLITFDLWGTLITNNPEFAVKRNELFHKHELGFTELKTSKSIFNSDIIEKYGIHVDRKLVYIDAFKNVDITIDEINEIIQKTDELFLKYPPLLIYKDTVTVLNMLIDRGYTLGVCSNTLLVYSDVLKRCLCNALNGYNLFFNMKFSDVTGYSKPHKEMFFADAKYHVGDNVLTDGACEQYGIKFIKINTSKKSLSHIFNELS